MAGAIGGDWPERAREALLAAPVEEPQDLGAMLLGSPPDDALVVFALPGE